MDTFSELRYHGEKEREREKEEGIVTFFPVRMAIGRGRNSGVPHHKSEVPREEREQHCRIRGIELHFLSHKKRSKVKTSFHNLFVSRVILSERRPKMSVETTYLEMMFKHLD